MITPPTNTEMPAKRGWGAALRVYGERPVLSMLFLGFSAGLPFYLVFSTLSAWLRTAHIDRATIGMLSWVGLMYSFKFLWAPAVDRVALPVLDRALGRRRSWMLVAQIGIAICLFNVALSDPAVSIAHVAVFALGVAFFAATQDIAIDAWRIESATADKQGAMAAAYQIGYRSALMVASAGALVIAGESGFRTSYLTMAALTAIGIVTTFLVREPVREISASAESREHKVTDVAARAHWPRWAQSAVAWFLGAVVGPIVDFFGRYGWGLGLMIFLFIASYRLTDYVSGTMANTFYIDIGFSVTEVGVIAKFFGWPSTLVGAVLGGVIVAKVGRVRGLLLGSVLVIVSNVFYATYGTYSCHLPLDCAQTGLFNFWAEQIPARGPATNAGLSFIVGFDNLALGVHGTALIAFMSSLTSAKYTATQYAVLSSLYSLPGKLLMGTSGFMVNALGYGDFYLYTALLSVPGLLLLLWLSRRDITAARD
ncbi:MAG TPA: MFS transporter [Steroidobacteraceae bacterium]|nr:MFS transporter [Steroidobacteraceae bacterium]